MLFRFFAFRRKRKGKGTRRMRGEILVTKVFSSSNYFPDIDFDQCLKGSNHENKFPDFILTKINFRIRKSFSRVRHSPIAVGLHLSRPLMLLLLHALPWRQQMRGFTGLDHRLAPPEGSPLVRIRSTSPDGIRHDLPNGMAFIRPCRMQRRILSL